MKSYYRNEFVERMGLSKNVELTSEDILNITKDDSYDIYNSKCVGIVEDKIYDISKSHREEKADKVERFTIDYDEKADYKEGEKVCIDSVVLHYDFIGIMDDPKDTNDCDNLGALYVEHDGVPILMYPPKGNGNLFEYIDLERNLRGKDGKKDYIILFNSFEGDLNLNTKCSNDKKMVNVKIFKQGLDFYVNNLVINVKGRIGNKSFSATKNYRKFDEDNKGNYIDINPVKITDKDTLRDHSLLENSINGKENVGLNFNPINLALDIVIPIKGRRLKSNLKIKNKLTIDCITPMEAYSGNGNIIANVRYNFETNFIMYSTTKEEIAVFVKNEDM